MTPKKRLKAQSHEASSLSTTRSQFLAMSTPNTPSTPLKHTLSPEWIHAITMLLGNSLTSEVEQNIQKWIIYHANLTYTKFAFKWDPILFEGNKHLQKYKETNGSIFYLKANTVKQLVSLKIYMILLICQDRPAVQNYHPTHFIKGEQLFELTAIDIKTALLNEMFENPRSKTTFRALMHKIAPPSSSASMRSPIHVELAHSRKVSNQMTHPKIWIYLISMIPPAPPPIWMKHTLWIPHVTIWFN